MKAILLVDMPSNCRECTFYDDEIIPSCWAHMSFTGRTIINYELLDKKQFCPLKPLPQKKESSLIVDGEKVNSAYEEGWNDCVDEILGENI